jgi:phage shock protein PspC (stress-responsive transcriptional regulator)
MVDVKRPVRRSATNKMIGGVLGGIAEWLGWDPSVVRVAYILVTVFSGCVLGVVAYAALWLFMPSEPGASPAA